MSETSETPVEHDAIEENPGAPARPDEPVTVTAPWHNAPGTSNYAEPEVTTVRAYDKPDPDGPLVAKVLQPPARPRATRGRRAATPEQPPEQVEESEDGDEDGEAS